MNKKNKLEEQDQKLLEEVEKILTDGNNELRETDSIYGFCSQLASTKPIVKDDFRQRLEARLVSRLMQGRKEYTMNIEQAEKRRSFSIFSSRSKWQMAVSGLVIAALLVAGFVAAYPPARALAQGLIESLRGEVSQIVVITYEDGEDAKTEVREEERMESLTLEETQDQYSFPVQLPGYLPDGYTEVRFDTFFENTLVVVVDNPTWPRQFFELYQGLDEHLYASDERLEEVLVNGMSAIWARNVGATYDDAGSPSPLIAYKLSWKKDGLYYTIRSYDLSQEEMIKIADSIK